MKTRLDLEIVFYPANEFGKWNTNYAKYFEGLPFHISIRSTEHYGISMSTNNKTENFYVHVYDSSCTSYTYTASETFYKMEDVRCFFINDFKIVKSFDEMFKFISEDICTKN